MENRPLTGVRVIELGTHVAVPTATRLMADWGAEVIKIEGLTGDPWRLYGLSTHSPVQDDENPIFNLQNANKRVVSLNLKTPEGLALLHRLLDTADIFVSNVRLKALEKLGLTYEALHEKHPGLVYFHFTGFGYEGAEADRPGFDAAAFWARSGALSDWTEPEEHPINPSSGFGDSTVSSHVLSGLLAALYYKAKTGVGMRVTGSLYASGIWYNSAAITTCQSRYGNPYPKHRSQNPNPFLDAFKCRDGESILVAALNYDAYRPRFFRILGLENYLTDPRFLDHKTLAGHEGELFELMDAAFLTKDRDEWCAIFEEEDIVYERMVHYTDVLEDPQAWDNRYLTHVTWKNGATITMPQTPVRFFDTPDTPCRLIEGVGMDTRPVLRDLGLTDEEIDALAAQKAIRMAK